MVSAIKTVCNGGTHYSPEIVDILVQSEEENSTTLTNREQTVIGLLANGLSNKQVAAWLNMCVRTVETHRRNIKAKIGISNTAELVVYAIEYGLIKGSAQ